jgi:hypothetical protein
MALCNPPVQTQVSDGLNPLRIFFVRESIRIRAIPFGISACAHARLGEPRFRQGIRKKLETHRFEKLLTRLSWPALSPYLHVTVGKKSRSPSRNPLSIMALRDYVLKMNSDTDCVIFCFSEHV